MARTPKPWFRKQTGWWMVTLGGRQHKLAQGRENKTLARQEFHKLMLISAEAPESAEANVASICDAFLQWSERNQASETYRGYFFYVQSFCEAAGYLPVRDLRPFHVTRWIEGKPSWGRTTQYNAVRSAVRVLNWAVKQGLLDNNPLKGMERPRPESRKSFLTDDEYRVLLRAASRPFKIFLMALRYTGARPSEVRELTWNQVHEDRWVLQEHKTVRKTGKPRVIHLSRQMKSLMKCLQRESKSKYVFVNCRGQKWTTNAVRLQMTRLRRKIGLRDDACVYELRHAYGTYGILNGVDPATLAELMGHVDTAMISRVYGHLAEQTEHLSAAAEKAARRPNSGNRKK